MTESPSTSAPSEADSLFIPDGADTLIPTRIAASAWGPDVLHGGPVAALVARAAELALPRNIRAEGALQPSRITVDLFRAVPRAPLTTEVEFIRQGRRVMVARVSVLADDLEVTRGQVLFLRRTEGPTTTPIAAPAGMDGLKTENGLNRGAPLAHALDGDAGTPALDDGFKSASFTGGYHHLVESRWPQPPGLAPGSIVWVHVQFPIVQGEEPSPFQRVAAVSDFGNALANYAANWHDPQQRMNASYINTDINVHLLRPPQGEWLCLAADRSTHIDGIGLVEVSHFDHLGHYAHATQARLANTK
jgi:acyl-CoA thioesterase